MPTFDQLQDIFTEQELINSPSYDLFKSKDKSNFLKTKERDERQDASQRAYDRVEESRDDGGELLRPINKLINKGLAEATDVLSLGPLQDKLPTLEELGVEYDENFEENASIIKHLQTQAKVLGRLGLNVPEFFLGAGRDAYREREKQYDAGLSMKEIAEQEDFLTTTLPALITPLEALGLGLPVKKFPKYASSAFYAVSQKLDDVINNYTGKIQENQKEGNTMPEVDVEKGSFEDIFKTTDMARGGDPDQDNSEYGGAFSNPITQEDPYMDIQKFINKPGYENLDELELFDIDMPLAKKKSNNFLDDIEGTKVAGMFGKAPFWAVAGINKSKILNESYSKGEANNLNNIKNKTVKEGSYEAQDTDTSQFLDDTIPDGTQVTKPKSKKIIDSPEETEDVFYSEIEARFMDPNTPETFENTEDFFKFLNGKGISKAEVNDYTLDGYLEAAKKTGSSIKKDDILDIVRKAPIRKVDRITYGSSEYGGLKNPQYAYQHMEEGYLPGTYRENVLFLEPGNIPLDPGVIKSGDPAHSFDEKYVLGWTRLSDRLAINPDPVVTDGIGSLAVKEVETLTKNIDTVGNQARELKLSALKKLSEEDPYIKSYFDDGLVDNDVSINRLYTNYADELKAQDSALYNQIEAFDDKLYKDAEKLKVHNNSSQANYINVTFADEIQSDILQQAKRFEEDITEALGDLIDSNSVVRANAIANDWRLSEKLNPEVVEFFLENETVFRPMFNSTQELQSFVDEFAKNKAIFKELADAGIRPSKDLVKKANAAVKDEQKMLKELKATLSETAMEYLYPNVPFKNRTEWGSALVKNDLSIAANRLYGENKVEGAGQWYAISPSKYITKRYGQRGGTATPLDQRNKDMKGIGMEEFYGGPDSVDTKGKHYTSVLEKILKKAAKENNSEFKVIKVKLDNAEYANTPGAINDQVKNAENFKEVFAIKITPEMMLPHKTHRKSGGFMYTPDNVDIFEVA